MPLRAQAVRPCTSAGAGGPRLGVLASWCSIAQANDERLTEGRLEDLVVDLPSFCSQARADMGFKHFAFILGAIGGQFKGAKVHAYGPAYGMGAAIIEFRL